MFNVQRPKKVDILEEIVAHKRMEMEQRMQFVPPRRLHALVEEQMAREASAPPSMRCALMDSPTGIIAEFKRKSPAKGWINREARAGAVPLAYQANGAAALSILTDTDYFGGYDEFVQEARQSGVTIPVLYKNFIVCEYQLFQARFCGASAVLLIAACLDLDMCRTLMRTARGLGLEVLLEMHGERDLDHAALEPDMYGVNNRNLGTFVTDVDNSFRLSGRLPQGVCTVSESGIARPETVVGLRRAGFRGFLMGEHFMRQPDPGRALADFTAALNSITPSLNSITPSPNSLTP